MRPGPLSRPTPEKEDAPSRGGAPSSDQGPKTSPESRRPSMVTFIAKVTIDGSPRQSVSFKVDRQFQLTYTTIPAEGVMILSPRGVRFIPWSNIAEIFWESGNG